MPFSPESYEDIVNILIYLAVIAHFLTAENNEKRVYFLVIVAGFFSISAIVGEHAGFFASQAVIVAWLILTEAEMIVSRQTMLLILAVVTILPATNPAFFIATFLFYAIVLGGFLLLVVKKGNQNNPKLYITIFGLAPPK